MTESRTADDLHAQWLKNQPGYQLGEQNAKAEHKFELGKLEHLMRKVHTADPCEPLPEDAVLSRLELEFDVFMKLYDGANVRTVSDLTYFAYWHAQEQLGLDLPEFLYIASMLQRAGHRFATVVQSHLSAEDMTVDTTPVRRLMTLADVDFGAIGHRKSTYHRIDQPHDVQSSSDILSQREDGNIYNITNEQIENRLPNGEKLPNVREKRPKF